MLLFCFIGYILAIIAGENINTESYNNETQILGYFGIIKMKQEIQYEKNIIS